MEDQNTVRVPGQGEPQAVNIDKVQQVIGAMHIQIIVLQEEIERLKAGGKVTPIQRK